MSALSILCLVLSFPFAFVFHDGEEAIVQRRWILAHEEKLSGLLPWFRPILKYLSRINTGAFIVAAIEEVDCDTRLHGILFCEGCIRHGDLVSIVHGFLPASACTYSPSLCCKGLCTGAVHIFFAPAICILWGVQHLPCHVSDGNAYVERCRCYLYGNKPDICPLVGNFNFGTG